MYLIIIQNPYNIKIYFDREFYFGTRLHKLPFEQYVLKIYIKYKQVMQFSHKENIRKSKQS